ncbi:MAG: hypothetical protein V1724_03890, partial [Chloroflexota bacterium]
MGELVTTTVTALPVRLTWKVARSRATGSGLAGSVLRVHVLKVGVGEGVSTADDTGVAVGVGVGRGVGVGVGHGQITHLVLSVQPAPLTTWDVQRTSVSSWLAQVAIVRV